LNSTPSDSEKKEQEPSPVQIDVNSEEAEETDGATFGWHDGFKLRLRRGIAMSESPERRVMDWASDSSIIRASI